MLTKAYEVYLDNKIHDASVEKFLRKYHTGVFVLGMTLIALLIF